MLAHIGQGAIAAKIHNAWLRTLEEGIHTADIYSEELSRLKVGTRQFAEAVVERLGEFPRRFAPAHYQAEMMQLPPYRRKEPANRELVGVDVFLFWRGEQVEELAARLKESEAQQPPKPVEVQELFQVLQLKVSLNDEIYKGLIERLEGAGKVQCYQVDGRALIRLTKPMDS